MQSDGAWGAIYIQIQSLWYHDKTTMLLNQPEGLNTVFVNGIFKWIDKYIRYQSACKFYTSNPDCWQNLWAFFVLLHRVYNLPVKDLKWLITRLFLPHQSQAHVWERLSHHNACSASQYVPVRVFGPIYLGISILIHLVAQWISRSCTFKKLTWPLPYASASHVGMKNVHLSVLSAEVTFVLVFQGHTFQTFSKQSMPWWPFHAWKPFFPLIALWHSAWNRV